MKKFKISHSKKNSNSIIEIEIDSSLEDSEGWFNQTKTSYKIAKDKSKKSFVFNDEDIRLIEDSSLLLKNSDEIEKKIFLRKKNLRNISLDLRKSSKERLRSLRMAKEKIIVGFIQTAKIKKMRKKLSKRMVKKTSYDLYRARMGRFDRKNSKEKNSYLNFENQVSREKINKVNPYIVDYDRYGKRFQMKKSPKSSSKNRNIQTPNFLKMSKRKTIFDIKRGHEGSNGTFLYPKYSLVEKRPDIKIQKFSKEKIGGKSQRDYKGISNKKNWKNKLLRDFRRSDRTVEMSFDKYKKMVNYFEDNLGVEKHNFYKVIKDFYVRKKKNKKNFEE